MIRVDLDNEMQVRAAEKGLTRAIRYIPQWEGVTVKRNFQHDRERLNFPAFVMQQTEAVGAELSVKKYFKLDLEDQEDKNYKNKADAQLQHLGLEVKWTKWKDGSLILTELDRKEDIAILVTGTAPTYYLAGWIPISVARRPQRQRADGSWWLSQSDLHPMANLQRSSHAV
ncbi:hypothetical protein UFOVP440_7 [uncultured Caudovirales phage]|uniref:Uncharacterized protein n=1 Tax=uncultured Caudovirales phage TaxID=2100421 RepID=A0A6J5M7T1_9CAUD|nr:hypothetical protein UFOVP440_7 [uncultured Caudovirales phage]